MAPSCQITQNGGWPSRTADQIRKSPAGCAIPIPSRTASPHLRAQGTTGYKTESAYFYSRAFRFATHYPVRFLFYPRPPSNSGRGFQRRGLALRPPSPVPLGGWFPKGRAEAPGLCAVSRGGGENRNPPAFLFRGPGGHSLFKREYPLGFSVPKRYSSAGNPGNLFGKTKRKWGFNPVRHRRTSSHQSGAFDISKEK